jgi:hypothetical protein
MSIPEAGSGLQRIWLADTARTRPSPTFPAEQERQGTHQGCPIGIKLRKEEAGKREPTCDKIKRMKSMFSVSDTGGFIWKVEHKWPRPWSHS